MKSMLIYEDNTVKIIKVPDNYFYEYLLIPENNGRMSVPAEKPKKKTSKKSM